MFLENKLTHLIIIIILMGKINFKKLGGEFIEDLGEYVKEYVLNHPGVSIYIGCDSDEVNAYTFCYVSTICFYDEFKKDGVHYIFSREFVESKRKMITKTGDEKEDKKKVKEAKQDNIFNKIWGEVERLAEIGIYLDNALTGVINQMSIDDLKKRGLKSHQTRLVNIDVDINPDPGLEIPSDLKGKSVEIRKYTDEHKNKLGRNRSNLLYDASRSYLEGLGFRTRFKPNAWAATVAADFHIRGIKKMSRKSGRARKKQTEL
jgi:predicted RNase H-related nuclease YkuK (DUF458 family)